jgi:hypothetical protein
MIWFLVLFVQIISGFQILFFILRHHIDLFLQISIAIPLGFGLSSLTFFRFATFLGMNFLHLLIHLLCLSFLSLFLAWKSRFLAHLSRFLHPDRTTLIFGFVSLILTVWIVPPQYFRDGVSVNAAFGNSLAEELSLMKSFYWGVTSGFVHAFKIRHPFCQHCTARSRWQTAFHSAMLRVGFASLGVSFGAPSALLFFSLCFTFCHFAKIFLGRVWLAVASLLAFLFAGGFGFVRWFWRGPRLDKTIDFVRDLGGAQTEWSHPILHYMFAYRPSLMSLAVMAGVVFCVSVPVKRSRTKAVNCVVGALLGLLPSVQYQAFIGGVIFVVVNGCLNYDVLGREEIWRFGAPFLVTVALQAVHFFPTKTSFGLASLAKTWDDLSGRGVFFAPLMFWASALGIFAVVSLVGAWFFIDRRLLKVYLPAIVVFIVGNCVKFQGLSLFVFYPGWMIVGAVVFVATLVRFAQFPSTEQGKGVAAAWATVAFVCAVASAMIGFVRLRGRTAELWSDDFERIGAWIAQNLPIKSIFIGVDREFNPVSTIAGRRAAALPDMILTEVGMHSLANEKKDAYRLLTKTNPDILPKVRYLLLDGTKQMHGKNWTLRHQEGSYRVFERN